ncbi:hypothetical protein GpartN1_g7213.t1 [Galdieria partita]|uniref:Uncharacterized protein n=1 Tax=Galdieria partita TaxID=83374 RepID=A0A9C7Q4L8_9RHOD|nr:hypothetical protein GpartN1_g7213.t1 [Galdieria partita]
MNLSEKAQNQLWTSLLTCGNPLIERETAKEQLESSVSRQTILWDKLQSVFVTCLQSESSVAKQETVVFFQQLAKSGQVDRETLAEQILNGVEWCSENLKEPPLELFSFLIELIVAIQSDTTRNFYVVRLLSNQYLEDIIFYVLCQYFVSFRNEERLRRLELLVPALSTMLCEHKKAMEEKIYHFLLIIYDYMDDLDSSEKKESLLVIVLRLLAIKPKSSSPSFSELGLLHKLWNKASQDISHRALILHYLLAQSFQGKTEYILSLWEATSNNNITEKKLWQQTILYYFGRNHWISITVWLVFTVLRMGRTSAAFQMKQLLDLALSSEMGSEKLHSSTLYLMEVIWIVIEYEYPNLSWISFARETWSRYKRSDLVDTSMPNEEPMSRHLYGSFTFPTAKFEIFRHFPKWVVGVHMLEDFLQLEGERMEELLWKWYNNLMHCSSTLQLWFALCCAHLFRQMNNTNRLSGSIHLFHRANSIEKLSFLPILFHRGRFCQLGKFSISWLQSWLSSCPVDSHYSLVLYKWLNSLLSICKKLLKNGNQGIRMYTLIVSVMLKESVTRGEPWKTTVVDEIIYCAECFPLDSPLQKMAYYWIQYLVEKRPTWVAYSLFSIVQQPLQSLSITSHSDPQVAACCIKIVCEMCQAKLLDYTKTFQTLYKWYCNSVSDSRELELAWIQFLGTVSSQKDGTEAFDKILMDSNVYLEIFNWISVKFIGCSMDNHNELRCIMVTWLLWLKKCLAIHSIANVQGKSAFEPTKLNILDPTEWNQLIESLFEKYFSEDFHVWCLSESEETLHQLVETMIQAVGLEWQYRKRLEWSAIERDHSIRKWSFVTPSIQEWLNQLETYTLLCPYGIIRCCLNNIFNLISSLVNEGDHSKISLGFYSLWILSYSQVVPFQHLFWKKWMLLLSEYWLSWMEKCTSLGWKPNMFAFWTSLWSRWSVQISTTCREWLLCEFFENIREEEFGWTDWKHMGLEMARFYILWDLLVGYPPMKVQSSLLLFMKEKKESQSNRVTEEIQQNVQNWWKDLFHIIETRPTSSEYLYSLIYFGNWTELILSYQRTLSVDTVQHMIRHWIGDQLIWLFRDDCCFDISIVLSLMRLLEPWKWVDFDWLSNMSEYGKSVVNLRYYCMHKGLCEWKTAFGLDFLQAWIQYEALSNRKEMYLDCSIRYGLSQQNLEQMIQIWMDCISSLLVQENKKHLYRLLEFLYNAWIECHDTKLNKKDRQFAAMDALVQLESWYRILFSIQNLHSSPIENSILQGLVSFSSQQD